MKGLTTDTFLPLVQTCALQMGACALGSLLLAVYTMKSRASMRYLYQCYMSLANALVLSYAYIEVEILQRDIDGYYVVMSTIYFLQDLYFYDRQRLIGPDKIWLFHHLGAIGVNMMLPLLDPRVLLKVVRSLLLLELTTPLFVIPRIFANTAWHNELKFLGDLITVVFTISFFYVRCYLSLFSWIAAGQNIYFESDIPITGTTLAFTGITGLVMALQPIWGVQILIKVMRMFCGSRKRKLD